MRRLAVNATGACCALAVLLCLIVASARAEPTRLEELGQTRGEVVVTAQREVAAMDLLSGPELVLELREVRVGGQDPARGVAVRLVLPEAEQPAPPKASSAPETPGQAGPALPAPPEATALVPLPAPMVLVDADEMDRLIEILDWLSRIDTPPTALPEFRAGYATKAGLSVAVDNATGTVQASLELPGAPATVMDLEELGRFAGLLDQALVAIEDLAAQEEASAASGNAGGSGSGSP